MLHPLHDSLRLSLEIALDRVSDGIVLVDAAGHLLHVNRLAREFFASRRCSRVQDGELRFLNGDTQRAFRVAVEASRGSREREPGSFDGSFDDAADRGSMEGPVDECAGAEELDPPREFLVRDEKGVTLARAAVEALRRTTSTDAHTFLVVLHPQPRDAAVSPRALVALYRLTPGEARVAAHAVNAASTLEIAQRLSLSINTVKVHLRSVFRKCQVGSFVELATLIATGPGVRSVGDRALRSAAAAHRPHAA